MKTKFAIGCLVQWYEADIVGDYIETLKEAVNNYDGDVWVEMTLCINTELEQPVNGEVIDDIIQRIDKMFTEAFPGRVLDIKNKLYTIADYRRDFNNENCEYCDVLVWGESDMLVPKQMFTVLDMLHQNTQTPKYIATFGICKMWDDSWKDLEHPKFTDKQHSDDPNDWWCINYSMNKDEMNSFNDKVEELEVTQVSPHKFNGCGLVISSEVVKSGVTIPKSVFFVHEDTAFMLMIRKVLGDIPQYHIKNILLVHNRKHPDKRNYIEGETGTTIGQKRNSNPWYQKANKMCEQNCYNNFRSDYKPYTWNDVWN